MDIGKTFIAWLPWIPNWLVGIIVFTVIVAGSFILQSVVVRLLGPLFRNHSTIPEFFPRIRGAIRFGTVLLAAAIAFPIIPMDQTVSDMLHGVLIAATIILAGWLTIVFANTLGDRYIGKLRLDVADNLHARKAVTQARILKRAIDTLLVILTLAFALMSFPSVRSFGVSLFASAGAAGLIVGLAARPLLENLFAGIQLAITQPIRLDDVLVVNGQWGWVEEINSTYIVMRLWDWRRYVLPLSYFLQNPFENWTRTSAGIIGSVYLYLDYTAPIDAIRDKATEIVKESKRWDGKVVNVQVSDAKTDTIEVRILVTATDSPTVWDLRCEVREKVLAYIASEHPGCLPRRRNFQTTTPAEPEPPRHADAMTVPRPAA